MMIPGNMCRDVIAKTMKVIQELAHERKIKEYGMITSGVVITIIIVVNLGNWVIKLFICQTIDAYFITKHMLTV